jgi:hypothetical protein
MTIKTYNTKEKALMNNMVIITNTIITTKHLHYLESAHRKTCPHPHTTEGYSNYMPYAHSNMQWVNG